MRCLEELNKWVNWVFCFILYWEDEKKIEFITTKTFLAFSWQKDFLLPRGFKCEPTWLGFRNNFVFCSLVKFSPYIFLTLNTYYFRFVIQLIMNYFRFFYPINNELESISWMFFVTCFLKYSFQQVHDTIFKSNNKYFISKCMYLVKYGFLLINVAQTI